jgi:O-antigen ligase
MAHANVPATRSVGLAAYATLCTAVVALLFLTNWPTYDYAVRGGPIPLYYYVLPALLIVPIVFAEPMAAVRFMREPLFWWFVIFVVTGLVWLLLAQDFVEDASRQWRLRVLAFMFFYTVTLLSSESHRRIVGWVIVACVLVACVFNWIDVLRPYRFVPQGIEGVTEGRGAGLFINPNAAGSFIVMGTIAALPMVPARLRGLLLITAVFGVAATFSRGAFVMISVALLGAIWLKLVKRAQGIVLILTLPLLILGVSTSYEYLAAASENRSINRVVERLNWFKDTGDEDVAVEGRKYGASQAWQLFLDRPVTGHGPGVASLAVRQEGPHNMYLLLMAEQGILGFILYVSLFVTLLRRGRRIARYAQTMHERDAGSAVVLYGLFLATYGFFSHNVLEEPHTIFLLAFVVATGFGALHAANGAPERTAARAVAARRMSSPA